MVEMILIYHNNFIGDVLKYLEYKKKLKKDKSIW